MTRLPAIAWSKTDKAVLRRDWTRHWLAGVKISSIARRVAARLLRTPSSVWAMALYMKLPSRARRIS